MTKFNFSNISFELTSLATHSIFSTAIFKSAVIFRVSMAIRKAGKARNHPLIVNSCTLNKPVPFFFDPSLLLVTSVLLFESIISFTISANVIASMDLPTCLMLLLWGSVSRFNSILAFSQQFPIFGQIVYFLQLPLYLWLVSLTHRGHFSSYHLLCILLV